MPPHSKVTEKRPVPLPTPESPERHPPRSTRKKQDVVLSSASDNSLVQTSPPPSSPPSLPLPTGRNFHSEACLCGRNASYSASNSQLTCADVQRSYFNDDPEHLLYGYISLPLGKSLEQAHRRKLWLKHLKVVSPSSGSSRCYIARHHFPPRAFKGHQYLPRVSTGGPFPYLECDDSERVSCLFVGAPDFFTVPNVPYNVYSVIVSNNRDLPPPSFAPSFGPHSAFVTSSFASSLHRTVVAGARMLVDELKDITESSPDELQHVMRDNELKLAELLANLELKSQENETLRALVAKQAAEASNVYAAKIRASSGGLSRYNLTSLEYHDEHHGDCMYFFGLKTFAEAQVWFAVAYEMKAVTMHQSSIFRACMAGKRPISDISMTPFSSEMPHFLQQDRLGRRHFRALLRPGFRDGYREGDGVADPGNSPRGLGGRIR